MCLLIFQLTVQAVGTRGQRPRNQEASAGHSLAVHPQCHDKQRTVGKQGWDEPGLRQAPCSWVSRMVSPPLALRKHSSISLLISSLPLCPSWLSSPRVHAVRAHAPHSKPPGFGSRTLSSRAVIVNLSGLSMVTNSCGKVCNRFTATALRGTQNSLFLSYSSNHRKISGDIYSGTDLENASRRCWQLLHPLTLGPCTGLGKIQSGNFPAL